MERTHLVPPSLASRDHACLGDRQPLDKLSRPQKRRRRAQRQAVQDVQISSAKLKSALGLETPSQNVPDAPNGVNSGQYY